MFTLPTLTGRFLFVMALLAFPGAGYAAEKHGKPLHFEDHFTGVEKTMPDGTTKLYPDMRNWAFTFWPGMKWPDSYGDGTNWLDGNAESQAYLSPFIQKVKDKPVPVNLRYDPFSIEKDGLHIKADVLSEEQRKAYAIGGHRRFGSGMIVTRFPFQYGRVSVVAKLPSAQGAWPAIWLLADNHEWPPEIDILEGMPWGKHKTQIHSGILALKEENQTHADWFDVGVDPSLDFHEYSMDWTPETITIYFDGKPLITKPTPASMKRKMYLLVNLAVGGKWVYNELDIKPIDGTDPDRLEAGADLIEPSYPAEMIVKSVKIKSL